MRQFKFRTWDKKMKEMTYSGKATDEDDHIHKSVGFFFSCYCEKMDGGWCPTVDIMQFTGLKDKKGKEIYEGDIVRFYPYELSKQRHKRGLLITGKIVFNENSQFCIRYVDMFEPEGETDYIFRKECEVIGNIYENPDLLTFQKEKETNSS